MDLADLKIDDNFWVDIKNPATGEVLGGEVPVRILIATSYNIGVLLKAAAQDSENENLLVRLILRASQIVLDWQNVSYANELVCTDENKRFIFEKFPWMAQQVLIASQEQESFLQASSAK